MSKYRKIAIALLLIISTILLAERPIKNYFLNKANNDITNQIKNTTNKELEDNANKDASYNFDDVKSINATDVVKQSRNKSKLPSIGEIAIPSLNMNLPIVKGTSNESMLVSAGTLKSNQKMGEGNYTLASHYSNAQNETLLFSPLKRASTGMDVYLTNGNYIYKYRISEIKIVHPESVDVLNDIENRTILTLITCEDLSATERRIVVCDFIEKYDSDTVDKSIKDVFNIPFKTY